MNTHGQLRPLLLSLVFAASVQARAEPGEPAPAAAPQATTDSYRSTFNGYRPYGDVQLRPWQQANETVRSRGGWRAYAREAQEPPPAASESSRPPSGPHSHDGAAR